MVLYEYKCDACGREWEDNERAIDLGKCQVCGRGIMKRIFSVPGLIGMPTRGSQKHDFRNRDANPLPEDEEE